MMLSGVFWTFTLVVSVEEILAQDPWRIAYTTKYDLLFFQNQLNFEQSKRACEEKESVLVKVDGEDISNAIRETINVSQEVGYWIGANDLREEGTWVWLDGTPAGKDSGAYQRWGPWEPNDNDGDEDCASVGFWHFDWFDISCSRDFYYICQKVSANPTIESIETMQCNSSLLVKWRPSSRAIGFEHRISVRYSSSDVERTMQTSTPASNNTIRTLVTDLSYATPYVIKVATCLIASCNVTYRVTRNASTTGKPNPVLSVRLQMDISKKFCVVHWTPPENDSLSKIFRYKITLESILKKSRRIKGSTSQSVTLPIKNEAYAFTMKANRKYSAKFQVENCKGWSTERISRGTCEAPVSAPANLSLSSTSLIKNENGTWSMTLEVPDESNGPLSCLFIIAQVTDVQADPYLSFTLTDLNDALRRTNGLYIAFALQMSRIDPDSSELNLLLGTGEYTTCDITDAGLPSGLTGEAKTSDMNVYAGVNSGIEQDKSYGIHVVSSTPANDGKILLKKSPMAFISRNKKDSVLAPALTTVCIVLLLSVLASWLVLRQRRKSASMSANNSGVLTAEVAHDQRQQKADYSAPEHESNVEPPKASVPQSSIAVYEEIVDPKPNDSNAVYEN